MGAFLMRLGGVLLVADLLYLVVWETRGGADAWLFRSGLAAAALCVAGGVVMAIVARGRSVITAKSCPRCGRKVARGRMYCEEHLAETINRYRDEQRRKEQ
jgi:hypothetical protein